MFLKKPYVFTDQSFMGTSGSAEVSQQAILPCKRFLRRLFPETVSFPFSLLNFEVSERCWKSVRRSRARGGIVYTIWNGTKHSRVKFHDHCPIHTTAL